MKRAALDRLGRRWAPLLGVAALALLVPDLAHADPKDDARRHFSAGLQAAQSGQYEVALQHFLAAQEAFPHPATLYNIARAYQDLNDLQNALTYYRLYRDADPTKATDIDPVIAVIDAKLRQQTGAPTTAVASSGGGGGGGGVGVPPEILDRLSALAAEMQAKVDEVNALTQAIAEGQVAGTADGTTGDGTTGDGTTGGTGEGGVVDPNADIPELPGGGFIEDAYQRVVVTASRYGQEPLDSPSAVTILTDEDIRLSGATSLPDVLRRAVGVDVMQLASGHSDVSIRGFNRELSNKVLVLIDGRSTYLDFIGTTFWSSLPIALEEIERIEIIRGPGSAVYGANAVTGVINIITRTPGEGKNLVKVEGGTPAYGSGTALISGRQGTTAYRLSAGFDQTGRWAKEIDPDSTAREFFFENQELGLQRVRANARLDRTFLDKGFASLSGGYSAGDFEFYNIGALGDWALTTDSHYLRGDLAYGDVHLRAFWNGLSGDQGPWSQSSNWVRDLSGVVDVDVVDVELEGSKEFETGAVTHRVNAGIGYRYKYTLFEYIANPETGKIVPVREHHQSAFVQEELSVSKLKLVGAIRADAHPLLPISQTLSPRGAAILRVAEDTSVRLGGGTAFRAPNHIENYMYWVLPSSVDGVYIVDYGDENLSPERIITAEVGLHDESTVYHQADVSIYMNQLSDIIYLKSVESQVGPDIEDPVVGYDPDIGGYLAGETGWSNTPQSYLGYGVEVEGEVFPTDGLDIFGNFAYTTILETTEGQEAVRDKSTSQIKANAGVTYRSPWYTDLSLYANYTSAQTWGLREFDAAGSLIVVPKDVPQNLVLSGRIGVHPLEDDSLEVALGFWNIGALIAERDTLLGASREHPKGQPVGAKAYGSLVYRF